MTNRIELTIRASRRLFLLLFLAALALAVLVLFYPSTVFICVLVGVLGGFVGIQRRMNELTEEQLFLLAESNSHVVLSPFVGGVLAALLYVLFLSDLVNGALFPAFAPDADAPSEGFKVLLATHPDGYAAYAKLIIWSFIAGYSERFVLNIVGQLKRRVEGEGAP